MNMRGFYARTALCLGAAGVGGERRLAGTRATRHAGEVQRAPKPAEFDRHAAGYRRMHAEAIRASGEPPEFFAAAKVRYMAAALPRAPSTLLDFGCGVGATLGLLCDAFPGAAVHGVDASAASLEIAACEHPGARLAACDDGRIPLPDASMDAALAACVFHHIAIPERRQWMRELRRVLAPGGRLFVFEHNPWNPLTRAAVRKCAFDADAVLLSRMQTRTLMRDAGFAQVQGDYTTFFPGPLAALRPLERGLGWLPLGAQYVVHGAA